MTARMTEAPGPDWAQFEQQVAAFLRELPQSHATVAWNQRVPSKLSGVARQIDALITAVVADVPVIFIAECKRYRGRVQIRSVDELVGKALDVGAAGALLFAFAGFTEGARARADGALNPTIALRQLPEQANIPFSDEIMKALEGMSHKFGDCANENCYTGDVTWHHWREGNNLVKAGYCDICGTPAVQCANCGSITAIDGITKCDGCELVYEELRDSSGVGYGFRQVPPD